MLTPVKCYPAVTKTSLFLHILGTLCYSYGIYYDRINYRTYPKFETFGGRFKYLTMINVYFTFAASLVASLADVLQIAINWCDPLKAAQKKWHTKRETSPLIQLRDELMSCWVYLLCSVVTTLFWGIAFIDLEGIHSVEREKVSPLLGWYNQFLHTFPLPYALLLITCVNYEYKPLGNVFLKTTFAVIAYLSWLAYCARVNGVWAYGFLRKLSAMEFAIFVCFCNVVILLVQVVGRIIASLVWNKRKSLTELEGKHQ